MKSFIRKIINLYIFLNLHVALSVVALYLLFHDKFNADYSFFLFFSTVFSYGLLRVINIEANRKQYIICYNKYKILFWLVLFISLVMSIYFITKFSFIIWISLFPLVALTVFYQTRFTYISFRRNGILKTLIVAFVWASLVIFIPSFIDKIYFTEEILAKFLFIFLYVLLLTLSFDQRDILIDQPDLKTLPQSFPDLKKFIYSVFTLILLILNFIIFNDIYSKLTGLLMILISILLCFNSNEKKSFYYTAFWIEALPVFWLLILKIL